MYAVLNMVSGGVLWRYFGFPGTQYYGISVAVAVISDFRIENIDISVALGGENVLEVCCLCTFPDM